MVSLPFYSPLLAALSLLACRYEVDSFSPSSDTSSSIKYFAIGSNMLPSTMTRLRGIPLDQANGTAGIAPDYRLAFDVGGGNTAAASIRYSPGHNCGVHGVLYDLTPAQFATLGRTEGVPLVYQWERCHVVPYTGNDGTAGAHALVCSQQQQATANDPTSAAAVVAFALTTRRGSKSAVQASLQNQRNEGRSRNMWLRPPEMDRPTSPSYLRILQQGAAYWKLDRSYQVSLSKVKTSRNKLAVVPDVFLGWLLKSVEGGNERPPRTS